MVAAVFECAGAAGRDRYYFEGETPMDLLTSFYRLKGPGPAPRSGMTAVKAVSKFLERYYDDEFSLEDIRRYSYLGEGSSFRCLEAGDREHLAGFTFATAD